MRLRGKIRHRLRRWGNSGFSQVKSSQFVDKVTTADVAKHLLYERSHITFLIPPRLHIPRDYE